MSFVVTDLMLDFNQQSIDKIKKQEFDKNSYNDFIEFSLFFAIENIR